MRALDKSSWREIEGGFWMLLRKCVDVLFNPMHNLNYPSQMQARLLDQQ